MKNRTTGQDLIDCAVNCAVKSSLSQNKMESITTDGARTFSGKNVRKHKLQAHFIDSDISSFHCIIHQESLWKPAPNLKHVVEPIVSVVNTVKARSLQHQQSKHALEDGKTGYEDKFYHKNMRCFNLGKVIKRIGALQTEIPLFLNT